MSKPFLLVVTVSAVLGLSSSAWAASATNAAGNGQGTMMNSNDPAANGAMSNGAMQQPTSPSANGSGTLKDSAEGHKQMMQQNTGQ